MKHLKNNLLTCTIVPLLILVLGASYYRFLVLHDYLVSYEGSCDPITESCFVGCEDETIEDIADCPAESLYFYTEVERYAADLISLCGDTILDCAAADHCTDQETDCEVLYCDPVADEGLCDESSTNDLNGVVDQPIRFPINN